MSNNFFPLTAEELVNRINKIPKVKLAVLPTPLEYLPNISKDLEINLYIKRDDCTALAFGGNKTRHLEFIMAKAVSGDYDCILTGAGSQSNWCRQTVAAANKLNLETFISLLNFIYIYIKKSFYKNINTWGYDLDYLLSGYLSIHPNYVSKMRDMKIDMSNIFKLLQEIKSQNEHKYFNKDFLLNLVDKNSEELI